MFEFGTENISAPSVAAVTTKHSRKRLRPVVSGMVSAFLLTVTATILVATPASATATSCYGGLNTATTAWGTCKGKTQNSWGGFKLTVNCYYYPQQTSYGQVPQSIYASCPGWSHVTGIDVAPAAY